MSLQPGANLRGQDLVRDAITEIFEDDVHSDAEVLDVLPAMLDVSLKRVLAERLELHSLALHVVRQLHAAQGIGLANLVKVAGVLLATNLLAPLTPIDGVANPPDLGTGSLSNTPRSFFILLLGMFQHLLIQISKLGTNRHQNRHQHFFGHEKASRTERLSSS